jgi:hypothetical protein
MIIVIMIMIITIFIIFFTIVYICYCSVRMRSQDDTGCETAMGEKLNSFSLQWIQAFIQNGDFYSVYVVQLRFS